MKKFFPYFLVLLAIAARFLPHPANFTPIAAVALFSGVYLNKRLSILLPITAMFLSDLLIGFYSAPIMISVYASFAVSGFLGWWLAKHRGVVTTFGTAIASSTIFFLITNWAVWQFGVIYPATGAGLMESYIAAIPFWRNMLLGDVFYVAILFGCYEGVRYWLRRKKMAPVVNK
ncbi:MAG: DUF6580 family putative transport protein [Patescibacteria group bacterium]